VKNEFLSNYLRYAGVGFEFAGAVALFCLIGYVVDRHWGISPCGIIVGVLVGIAVGSYLIIKAALAIEKEQNQIGKK